MTAYALESATTSSHMRVRPKTYTGGVTAPREEVRSTWPAEEAVVTISIDDDADWSDLYAVALERSQRPARTFISAEAVLEMLDPADPA